MSYDARKWYSSMLAMCHWTAEVRLEVDFDIVSAS